MNARTLLYAFLALQAIHAAAYNEPANAVELQNAVTSVTLDTAETVFRQVCEAGRFDLIKDLMHNADFLQLHRKLGGTGPLVDWALALGYPQAARAIVYASDDLPDLLVRACGKGYLSVVDILLKDPEIDPTAGGVYTPMIAAVTNDQFAMIRYMQTCPRRAEFFKPGSRNAVYQAMRNGNLESLVILIEHDQESHAKLNDKDLEIDVSRLSPDALRACIAGDLAALKASVPEPFHSLDEFDVLLGLARNHPKLVAFLKRRQHRYLRRTIPCLAEMGDFAKGSLLRSLESMQKYSFFIGRQIRFMAERLEEYLDSAFKFSQLPATLEAYSFKWIDP